MEISLVKLRNSYQTYYVETNNLFVKHNTSCIVETEHGLDIGSVLKSRVCKHLPDNEINGKLLRMTNEKDLEKIPEIEGVENKAYKICKEKAKNKKLDMKLISVKCLFDKTKIIFYFVAESRIDFRELVRELAAVFRTRIEMRQIGVRDEARIVGGYGPCGRQLCCVNQCQDFDPVSIKMAKEQNLNLNSLKISGMCGRLLCCLSYEYDTYKFINESLPAEGTKIYAKDKVYTVISIDTLNECIRIREKDRMLMISSSDLEYKDKKYYIKEQLIENIMRHYDEHDEYDEYSV